ncbi:MAG: polymer-forming cytoskeletal protein [Opitutales bacterium]|nr:polymer-forming cytoskeletal protein [Opitutales bacterium]
MKKSPPSHTDSLQGSILLPLLAVILLFGILGSGIIQIRSAATEMSVVSSSNQQAMLAAQAGRDYFHTSAGQALLTDSSGDPLPVGSSLTIELSNNTFLAEIEDYDEETDEFTIKLTSFSPSGVPHGARVTLPPFTIGLPSEENGDSGDDEGFTGDTPDDYVVYSGGGAGGTGGTGFALPSGGTVDGSLFSDVITIASGNNEVTGNIISLTSVTLGANSSVGGFICATDGDVILQSSNTVITGDIRANGNVVLQSGTAALGSIYATGNVTLDSSNAFVGGDIHAGGNVDISQGDVLGNVYAGWNVNFNGNTDIGGDVHTGNNITSGSGRGGSVQGNTFAGGAINDFQSANTNMASPPRTEPTPPTGCPPPPPPPSLQNFTAGAEDIVVPQNGSLVLAPGTYGDLTIGGGSTLTLQAGNCDETGDPGCYVFKSFGPGSWGQTLRLDLSTGDRITVLVEGPIRFSGPVQVSTDGVTFTNLNQIDVETAKQLTRRVYWETHQDMHITGNNGTRQWMGTVLSIGNITAESGFYGVGAFATLEGVIDLKPANPTMIFQIADFAFEQWLD